MITSPHIDMADARAELRHLRQTVAAVAAEHGLAILAAGTHPTALWRRALQTAKQRYDTVMDDLQMIGQRDLLCGMHVHVELPDPDDARRRDVPDAALSAAVPCAVDLVAVLAVAARPGSRATGLPPMTNCRAPGCPSCSAPARNSTPMWRRWCTPA